MTFNGTKLKQTRRDEMKLSRQKFLDELNKKTGIKISEQRLSRIENKPDYIKYKTDLKTDEVCAICKITGKNLSYFLA